MLNYQRVNNMKTKKHGDKNTTYVSVSESKLWPSISRVCLLADDKRVTPTSTQPIGAGLHVTQHSFKVAYSPKKIRRTITLCTWYDPNVHFPYGLVTILSWSLVFWIPFVWRWEFQLHVVCCRHCSVLGFDTCHSRPGWVCLVPSKHGQSTVPWPLVRRQKEDPVCPHQMSHKEYLGWVVIPGYYIYTYCTMWMIGDDYIYNII